MSMLPPMSDRLQMAIIWIDETHIRLLVNDRDAWQGTAEVVALLKQLEELDYIVLSEYDDGEMTTYQLTEQDKAVSHRELRKSLYFRYNLISSLDADDQECAAALRTIADIEQIAVLRSIVGNDGIWAARQMMGDNP